MRKLRERGIDSLAASLLGLVILSLGTFYYLSELGEPSDVSRWLVWPLLASSGLALIFHLALLVGGNCLLVHLLDADELPAAERFVYSMAIGLALFALLMYGAGALGIYGPWFALLLPLGLIGLGFRGARRYLLQARAQFEARPPLKAGPFAFSNLAILWGGVMLFLLYLTSLTPNSFNFDAIWYHIPVAQDYAREGAIVPFYGDNHRAYPHLASLIHTWALLVPGLENLPLRWMLMLQLELGSVIWRLVGAVAVAGWCLNGRRVPGLWVTFFLFPSVFIYDQNIAGSADHVLGMTAAPLFLAVARMIKRLDPRYALLAGLAAGCHILTKYQAIYLVLATAAVVTIRFLWLWQKSLIARLRRTKGERPPGFLRLLRGPLLVLGAALFVSSPHFIKNIVYYDNPVYPFASDYFPSSFEEWEKPDTKNANSVHPTPGKKKGSKERAGSGKNRASKDGAGSGKTKAARSKVEKRHGSARQSKAGSNRKGAAKRKRERAEFTFASRSSSFDPQGHGFVEKAVWVHKTLWDWSFETGNRGLTKFKPYMGSLFTLLLPLLLILRRKKRLLFATLYTYLAFLVWGLSSANDRYLLTFLSIPIGITAALIVRAWELGRLARVGLIALVFIQFVRASEAPFLYGERRLSDSISLFKRGSSARSLERLLPYHRSGIRLTQEFPEDALVLGRYFKALLGFDRATLNTHGAIQKYIKFRRLENPRELWQICKDRGVTHLLYPDGKRKPVTAQDAILFDALAAISEDRKKVSGNVIVRLADEAPPNRAPFLVLVKGIPQYRDGLYRVAQLSANNTKRGKRKIRPQVLLNKKNADDLLGKADAVYTTNAGLTSRARPGFKKVERFGSLSVWLRKKTRHGAQEGGLEPE